MTNLIGTLNDQLTATKTDLENYRDELTAIKTQHQKEITAVKLKIKIAESIIKDIERKINKIQVK